MYVYIYIYHISLSLYIYRYRYMYVYMYIIVNTLTSHSLSNNNNIASLKTEVFLASAMYPERAVMKHLEDTSEAEAPTHLPRLAQRIASGMFQRIVTDQRYVSKDCHLSSGFVLETSNGFSVVFSFCDFWCVIFCPELWGSGFFARAC